MVRLLPLCVMRRRATDGLEQKLEDLDVQQVLGRRPSGSATDPFSPLVHLQDLTGAQRALVDGAGGDRQSERAAADHRAEVAARAEDPTALVEPAADRGEVARLGGK